MPEGAGSVPEFVPGAGVSAWPASTVTDPSREDFYKAILDRRQAARRDSMAVRRLGLIGGVGGAAVGLLGVLAALVVYVKTPVPPPPGYVLIDKQTGVLEKAVAAEDAPRFFPETVRERALADYISACESYVPETFARLDYHACMVMSAPAEQKRREADIGVKGTRYPPTVYGPNGWAKPSAFYAFTFLGTTGGEPNQTFHYQVRYELTRVSMNTEAKPRYTARIDFSFHPELKISPRDRLINPTGLQVVAYSTTQD